MLSRKIKHSKNNKILDQFENIFLDFDGVLFNSNFLKGKAIKYATNIDDNNERRKLFINFFVENNGLPRELKIKKFYPKNYQSILERYNNKLSEIYGNAKLTHSAYDFLEKYKQKNFFILSGGNLIEIKTLLHLNNLEKYFTKIFCAPELKEKILTNNKHNKSIFIGDSKVDYEAANKSNTPFILMTDYSDWKDWILYISTETHVINNLSELN